jgi:hypothetical protein
MKGKSSFGSAGRLRSTATGIWHVTGVPVDTRGQSLFLVYSCLSLFAMYFVAKPFYVFASGSVQPAEVALLLIFAIIVGSERIAWEPSLRQVYFWAFAFIAYAVLCNLAWAVLLVSSDIAISAAFYVFNGIGLLTSLYLVQRFGRSALVTAFYGCVATVAVQLVATNYFEHLDEYATRTLGFFNNPNQLGYWSVLTATIILVIQRNVRISNMIAATASLCCLYLAALSLSKSAIMAMCILFVLHFVRRPVYLIVAIAFIFTFFQTFESTDLFLRLEHRYQLLGTDSDDTLEARGYDLLWNYWQFVFFGGGEGEWHRFHRYRELHSSFGTILFCYGIIGAICFSMFLTKIGRVTGLGNVLYLIPAFIFGVAHQGLRFTLFWVLLGILPGMKGVTRAAITPSVSQHGRRPS